MILNSFELSELSQEIKFPVYFDDFGDKIFDADNKHILDLRGWGWIQKLDSPEDKRNALGHYLVEAINKLDSNGK